MNVPEVEQAFAEHLLLLARVPGVRWIPLVLRRVVEGRPLWELAKEAHLATAAQIDEARHGAETALDLAGPQAFSFTEGGIVGPWELVEKRGAGIGGEVWLARNSTNPSLGATLRLVPPGTGHDPSRRLRFVERSNPGLEPPHPSILKVDEADEDFGWLYTASVGVEARGLSAILAAGPLPEASAIALGQSLANSLHCIHDLGVVHGGISPLGVLLVGPRMHLSDFGVGSALLDGPPVGNRPGGRLGQLLFAHPGLVAGDAARGLDARDDLYALGATLYWALSRPGDAPAQLGLPWLAEPQVSPGLRIILGRCLSLDPQQTYGSARALLADLARVQQGAMPGPLVAEESAVRGRRAPTAVPQTPVVPASLRLRTTTTRPVAPPPEPVPDQAQAEPDPNDALYDHPTDPPDAEAEAEEEEAAAPAGKPRRMRGSSERLRALTKPPAAAKGPEGNGWLAFAASLLLVVGGLVVANVRAQPTGKDAGRAQLLAAEKLLLEEPTRWGDAVLALDAAAPRLKGDPALLAVALARREDLLERSEAERRAILPAGLDAEPAAVLAVAPKLEELARRAHGLPVATLVELDLARGRETLDLRTWLDLGTNLLNQGLPAAAVIATGKSGRAQDKALAEQLAALSFVPGGHYVVLDEKGAPSHAEREPMYVGRTEVTRGEYRRFLAALKKLPDPTVHDDSNGPKAKDHTPTGWDVAPAGDDALPATGVDYWDALAYAAWRGASLPDLGTWLAAARGRACRRFPWGDGPPSLALANLPGPGGALPGPAPVGCWPGGAGADGALDLVGNVEEWCLVPLGMLDEAPVIGGHAATPAGEDPMAFKAVKREERTPLRGFRIAQKAPQVGP